MNNLIISHIKSNLKRGKLNKVFFLIIPFLFFSCASDPIGEKKYYWSVRLASQIDGLYRIESTQLGDQYCFKINQRGDKVYADSCESVYGYKMYNQPRDIASESLRLVEESCGSTGAAKFVGSDQGNEYVGTSPVSCSSRKIGNYLSTDCYGGHAQFSPVLLSYFRCEIKNQKSGSNKSTLPNSDKTFLDNMLKSGKITQNQYDNILNGTPLTTDVEITKTTSPVPDAKEEETKDLFLDY